MRKRATTVLTLLLLICLTAGLGGVGSLSAAAQAKGIVSTFSESFDGWVNQNPAEASVELERDPTEGGVLHMTFKGNDPGIKFDYAQPISTEEYSVLAVRMKVSLVSEEFANYDSANKEKDFHAELVFCNDESRSFTPDKELFPSIDADSEYHTYLWNFRDNNLYSILGNSASKFTGSITALRFDPCWFRVPTAGKSIEGECWIDYIRWYGSMEQAQSDQDNQWEDDASVGGEGSELLFPFTYGLNNWSAAPAGNIGWENAGVGVRLGAEPVSMRYRYAFGVDALSYRALAVKLINSSNASSLTLRYATKGSPELNAEKSITLEMQPNFEQEQLLVFDLSQQSQYYGLVRELELILPEGEGSVWIDYAAFLSVAADADLTFEDDVRELPDCELLMWNFAETTEGFEVGGATAENAFQALSLVPEGKVTLTKTFDTPLNSAYYPTLRIRVRNRAQATELRLYFAGEDEDFDLSRSVATELKKGTRYESLVLDLTDSGFCQKPVSKLRIELADAGNTGDILFDYLRFYRSLTEAEEDGDFEDDPSEHPYAHTLFNFGLLASNWKNASEANGQIVQQENGIRLTAKGLNPAITYQYESGDFSDWEVGVDAYSYRYAVIHMTVNAAQSSPKAQFFFQRDLVGENTFDKNRSLTFDVQQGEGHYVLDLTKNHYYTGTISAFKFQPILDASAGDFAEIDYILLCETAEQAQAAVSDRTIGQVPREAKSVFDFTKEADAFDNARQTHSSMTVTEEGMKIDIVSNDPVFIYQYVYDGIGLDTTKYKAAKIVLKNNTPSTLMEFYYETLHNGVVKGWGMADNYKTASITANDSEFKEYVLDFTNESDWVGVITKLRLDPAWFDAGQGEGSVTVKSLTFYETLEDAMGTRAQGGEDGIDHYLPADRTGYRVACIVLGCLAAAAAVAGGLLMWSDQRDKRRKA